MEPNVLKVKIRNLNADRAEEFRKVVRALPGVNQVDLNVAKGLGRIISAEPILFLNLRDSLRDFDMEECALPQTSPAAPPPSVMKLRIDGMTCRSCEVTIEQKFRKIPGVKKVDVDATRGLARIVTEGNETPPLAAFESAIKDSKYTVRGYGAGTKNRGTPSDQKRPTVLQLVGLFGIVLILGAIFSKTGLLKPQAALGTSVSFAAAFFIGLVAASSSCVAVTGGLLLGVTAKFRERYAALTPLRRMQPVFLFIGGRLASYGILGGVIGLIGNALSPSPFVTGLISLVAALFMLVMGLDMLHLAPAWLKRCLPRMPKALAHRVMEGGEKTHPGAPFLLGAGTFFLPCGFTQALQLYVLTTGSILVGASILFAFALGTTPALLALGWASGSLKGAFGRFFFRFSGALVIVLGLWNIQNGLTIAGYPLALPRLSLPERALAAPANPTDPSFVRRDGNTQVVPIDVSYAGFWPAEFALSRGVPTRFEVSGEAAGIGCLAAFQIPKLGIRQLLQAGKTTAIAFTPDRPGNYTFSCSMGMFRGQFTVL